MHCARFLHWLSPGVPTLYCPAFAYKDLADKYNFGHTVKMSLAAITANDILKAMKLLHSYKRREMLSKEGLAIAEDNKVTNVAKKLISIIRKERNISNIGI